MNVLLCQLCENLSDLCVLNRAILNITQRSLRKLMIEMLGL
jgi:hypothetical protein